MSSVSGDVALIATAETATMVGAAPALASMTWVCRSGAALKRVLSVGAPITTEKL